MAAFAWEDTQRGKTRMMENSLPDALPFTKMQGVGNDFVVVDGRAWPGADWPALAEAVCHRKWGVGADGLLVLDTSAVADFRMRMFNPDGSEDMCGNGLRCLVRFAREMGVVGADALRVETLVGVRGTFLNRAASGAIVNVTVNMGQPLFAPADIPMRADCEPVVDFPLELADGRRFPVTALSTGSTHAVAFVDTLPDDAEFFAVSPQVEHHERFPERTSLMWLSPESPTRLRLRIWERGAGETWGCGTGACAAAVAATMKGFAPQGAAVTVASKGGELTIVWGLEGDIQMTGPAEVVFTGFWPRANGGTP